MPGHVGRRAGSLRRTLTEMGCHSAEGPLVNLALRGSGKRYAVMLKFNDRWNRFPAHVFDRVLISQPVRTLDGVVHVPTPVVFIHIPERGADTALCRGGMTAGRENLGDTGGLQPFFGHPKGSPQSGTASANYNRIVGMFFKFVTLCHEIFFFIRP